MKPILFNTEMVRAILEGRKTVTRRPVKPQPRTIYHARKVYDDDGLYVIAESSNGGLEQIGLPYCPGDILYVRESLQQNYDGSYSYRAGHKFEKEGGWHPSIHMPKEAARIFLRVTDVRVERLQEITEVDAEKEGLRYYDDICRDENWHPTFYDPDSGGDPSTVAGFAKLWNSTIKPTDLALYGWEANPWVWVIEFERCEKPKEVTP